MQAWSLGRGDPLSLEIACDARLAHPDFANDHIWEVHLDGGEPPSLSVETTYGLRARQMRLYPRFHENGQWLSDPAEFTDKPRVSRFYPNTIAVQCKPFSGVDVCIDYWVPDSHVLAGRLQISNYGELVRQINLEWVAQLLPLAKGEGMTAWQQVVSPVLKGQAENLWPVFFLTGGPEIGTGSFASLVLPTELNPGESRVITWALAALGDPQESFELARQVTARPWEAEMSRIERANASQSIEISSSRPDWDTIFALSQKTAHGLIMGPESGLPEPSFVCARRPDFGFSPRGDGSDYPHLWNGQTALAAHYLSTQTLPADLEFRQGLLMNFLSAAGEDGTIDMKPGLAGQRSRFMAQPLLCQLAWGCFELGASPAWMRQVFPSLIAFIQAWFSPEHDRDGDGLPEWDNLQQVGFEDHPLFSRAEHGGEGLDITTVEDPALYSLLLLECQAMDRISEVLDETTYSDWLEASVERLKQAIHACWDKPRGAFLPRDRDTNLTSTGTELASFFGSNRITLECQDCAPTRLLIHLKAATENTRSPRLTIHGSCQGQEIQEEITTRTVFWVHNQAWITTQRVYTRVDQVEVRGLDPRDEVVVRTVDLCRDNLTSFLPLLAGVYTEEQAQYMVDDHLASPERYCLPYGMPAYPTDTSNSRSGIRTSLPWNAFIISGLLDSGYPGEAEDLFDHMMEGISQILRAENRFQAHFAADTAQSGGDDNALEGLAPLGLFLRLSGITIYSPWKVLISKIRPLAGPITVKYQGMRIERTAEETRVTFPDGQLITVAPDGTHLVSLTDL